MDELTRREVAKRAATGLVAAGAVGIAVAGAAEQQPEAKAAPEGTGRGSEKMIEQMLGDKGVVEVRELRRLVTALQDQGARIVDWHQVGQGPPDLVVGRFEVGLDRSGGVLETIFKGRMRPEVFVFPKGLPPVIDSLVIEFRTGRAKRG